MKLEDDITLLSRVALFEGFASEHLRLLAFGSEKKTYPANSQVFREGQKGDFGFVIAVGTVELYTRIDKKKLVFAEYTSGALIGEMALISNNERVTSALAKTNVIGYKISQNTFHRILEEYPDLAILLHQRISEQVNRFVSELSRLQSALLIDES